MAALVHADPAPAVAEQFLQVLDGVCAVYQPVVDLDRDEVVGYEALVRGRPPFASPLQLFTRAAELGMTAELDWACRSAAFTGALEGGLRPPATLFINADPSTLGVGVPAEHQLIARRAAEDLKVVVEVSEKALLAAPAEMLDKLEAVRDLGWGIALDDVGHDWNSLALATLVRPDVVKLDRHLIQGRVTPDTTRIVRALESYSRESGARLLAEGVEDRTHLARARAFGAHLAQGGHFGWPTALPGQASRRRCGAAPITRPAPIRDETPAEIADAVGLEMRVTDELSLEALSIELEHEAGELSTPAVVLSCFQNAARFTADAARRYTELADHAAFVAVFGRAMPAEPAPHVRGVEFPRGHRLADEVAVVALTPEYARALIARPYPEIPRAGRERRFEYAITDDREVVLRVARALARSIAALAEPELAAA